MKNSPSICQRYVGHVLLPIHKLFKDAVIPHYMDDILICAKVQFYLDSVVIKTIKSVEEAGFEIQEEKVQRTSPWTYLGLRISKQTIVPQQLAIKDSPKTLQDLHQLCRSISWVCLLLGITRTSPLFSPYFEATRTSTHQQPSNQRPKNLSSRSRKPFPHSKHIRCILISLIPPFPAHSPG